ncbi:BTB/POZ domain-containing protein 2 [Halotydeus destructor]|nr:BTB/POZ domain-containing protein 2 [Halotydeus destructor]
MDNPGPSKNFDCNPGQSGSRKANQGSNVAANGSPRDELRNLEVLSSAFSFTPRANEEPSNQQEVAAVNSPEASPDGRAPVNQPALATDFNGLIVSPSASNVNLRTVQAQNQRFDDQPFNATTPFNASQSVTSSPSSNNIASFNWQSTKWSVKDRLSAIFNKEMLADVHFVVGKGTPPVRIPAHKFVLSIGSAVFDAMFNGKMAHTEPDIELPDVEPAAFLALLKFLYTDEVSSIGPETVMTTLYTAKKYAVPSLEKNCVDFLKLHLNSDNAFMLLTQARLFDEAVLAQMCLDTIDKNTVDAISAEGFMDIDHETLCMVLARDTLRVREVVLFNAVTRWAEAECLRTSLPSTMENQRSVLKRALTLIRFPLMTVEEFATEVAQSGMLSDREVVNLFLYFTVNPKPCIQFPDGPRCSMTGKEQVVHRFARTESRWGYSGTSDRIRFVVDRRIFVLGFGLYGSIHGPSDYDCNIQLIHTGTGKVLASNDTNFSCDGTPHTFRVTFKMPVEILPNTNYTACATLKGSDSHYGTGGNRKVIIDLHGGGKVTFNFSYAAGCNNGTSVEDGQVPEIIFYT